ncbi:hypothetical protein A9Q81_06575 [Gammaproteobacteria bacterium 42_54_T18]|nr:hypothetical protein A9Q81_06575 [Gammaproteobacteria bacterium 42_54_T18]
MTYALIQAFFDAKFSDADASKALYSIASGIEGQQMVTTLMQRSQASIYEITLYQPLVRIKTSIRN